MNVIGRAASVIKSTRGESLIETALSLPLLLMLLFNALNIGYFFFVTLNLTSAPRTAVLYSMLGGQTQNELQLPPAVSVKDLAMAELGQIGHLFVSLPWGVANYETAKSLMGDDYWSYGYEPNRKVLDYFLAQHHAQGLSVRRLSVDKLFHPATYETFKV